MLLSRELIIEWLSDKGYRCKRGGSYRGSYNGGDNTVYCIIVNTLSPQGPGVVLIEVDKSGDICVFMDYRGLEHSPVTQVRLPSMSDPGFFSAIEGLLNCGAV